MRKTESTVGPLADITDRLNSALSGGKFERGCEATDTAGSAAPLEVSFMAMPKASFDRLVTMGRRAHPAMIRTIVSGADSFLTTDHGVTVIHSYKNGFDVALQGTGMAPGRAEDLMAAVFQEM